MFVAAGLVWLTGSGWPDLLLAAALALLLLGSAWRVIGNARAELRASAAPESAA